MTDSTHDDRQVSNEDDYPEGTVLECGYCGAEHTIPDDLGRQRCRECGEYGEPANVVLPPEDEAAPDGGLEPPPVIVVCCGRRHQVAVDGMVRCARCSTLHRVEHSARVETADQPEVATDGGAEDPLVDLDHRVRQLEDRVDELEDQLDVMSDDVLDRIRRIGSMIDLQVRVAVERGDIDADEVARIREGHDA